MVNSCNCKFVGRSNTWSTIVPTKSDNDVILCLQLLRKKNNLYTPLQLMRIDRSLVCINPILRIGLVHKWSINSISLITLQTKHDVTVTLGWQDSSTHHKYKSRIVYCRRPCADPESFVRGGPTLTTILFYYFISLMRGGRRRVQISL